MKIVQEFNEFHQTTDTLLFSSRDFRVIRIILRLLSLWRPRSAGIFESYIYPILINLSLFFAGIMRNSIQATKNFMWLSMEMLYLVHEVVVWLGHILGNHYFASRDLETNVLSPVEPLAVTTKSLNRRLKVLNTVVIISMTFFSIMLCVLFVVTEIKWNKGAQRFSAGLPHVHGPLDHILYGFVLLMIVYDLGIGLALFWTLALLYCCYAARLKILENTYVRWKHSSADAVSSFLQLYAQPVKTSWKRISWWFLVQNSVAVAIPLYGYKLALAVSGREYHSKHLPQFVCYLVFIFTIWLAPMMIGEKIKRRERKFRDRINNISPWSLEVEIGVHRHGERRVDTAADRGVNQVPMSVANDLHHHLREAASRDSMGSNSTKGSNSSPKYAEYTFVCRDKELENFLRFLKQRSPGLVSRGYSLQLSLSIFSLIGGAISFLTQLHALNGEIIYTNLNCTMS